MEWPRYWERWGLRLLCDDSEVWRCCKMAEGHAAAPKGAMHEPAQQDLGRIPLGNVLPPAGASIPGGLQRPPGTTGQQGIPLAPQGTKLPMRREELHSAMANYTKCTFSIQNFHEFLARFT